MGAAEALGGLVEDELCGSGGIAKNVAVPETNDAPALSFEVSSSLCVICRLTMMLAAIDLHDQFCLSVR